MNEYLNFPENNLDGMMKLEDEISQKQFHSQYHKAVVNIIYSYNWLIDYQIQILKPFNITLQQYNILRILRGQHPEPATIKLIKERMLDKMSDASRLVEKLRLKGLADRKVCPSDRRNVDVCITDKGLKLLAELDRLTDGIDTKLLTLNEEEITALNNLLDKLRG